MKRTKVVALKNLPSRSPFLLTLVAVLALDHWHAPGWAWGAVTVFLVITWAGWIITFWTEESAEVFPDSRDRSSH